MAFARARTSGSRAARAAHRLRKTPGSAGRFSFWAWLRDSNLRFACCAGPAMRSAHGVRPGANQWFASRPGSPLTARQLRKTPGTAGRFSFWAWLRDSNLRFACCAGPAMRSAHGVRPGANQWFASRPGSPLTARQLRKTPGIAGHFSFWAWPQGSNLRFACCAGPATRSAHGWRRVGWARRLRSTTMPPSARRARSESGGIGRRPGFRYQCRKACGFESRLSHHARWNSKRRSWLARRRAPGS